MSATLGYRVRLAEYTAAVLLRSRLYAKKMTLSKVTVGRVNLAAGLG